MEDTLYINSSVIVNTNNINDDFVFQANSTKQLAKELNSYFEGKWLSVIYDESKGSIRLVSMNYSYTGHGIDVLFFYIADSKWHIAIGHEEYKVIDLIKYYSYHFLLPDNPVVEIMNSDRMKAYLKELYLKA